MSILVQAWPVGIAVLVAAAAAWVGTWAVLRWEVLAPPSRHGIHDQPAPTAGGIGLVCGFGVGAALLFVLGFKEILWQPFLAAGAVLAVVAVDDIVRPLKVTEKAGLQLLAALAWILWGPRLEQLSLPGALSIELGGWALAITVLWCVSIFNVFNFLDGLDGLVAAPKRFGHLLVGDILMGYGYPAQRPGPSGRGRGVGFLRFNWPPARIFMGDIGAHFLGLFWFGLGVAGVGAGLALWLAALPMVFFFWDASYTLVRRALRRENILQAHRQHLYQRLYAMGWSGAAINGLAAFFACLGGGAGWAYLREADSIGGTLLLLTVLLLAGTTVWIEREERRGG